MDEFGAFLGHFHPVWVHLPIGILLLLGILEVAGLASRSPRLAWLPAISAHQRTLILAIAAAAAIVAAALGWLLARGGDYDPALIARHRSLGIATAGATVLLLAVRRQHRLYAPALALSLMLLTATADAGAKITHGTNYLTGHMPSAIGWVLGISIPAAPPKPRAVAPDQALVFGDVVRPILQERCVGCHGPAKSNGGLRLDTWEMLAKGGKHGAVINPGDLATSALVKRIDLPPEAKEHMPPKGKPQLADDDLTLLEWWVGAGADHAKTVAALAPPPSVAEIISGRLGGAPEAPPDRLVTLAKASQIAGKLAVIVRPLTPDGPWIEVNAHGAGKAFGDAELAQLAPLAPAVEWLDLGSTSVTDAGLVALEPMRRLGRLHLDRTKITDAGLARLSRLSRLEYLNLRGTAVTDKGLASLRGMPRLRSLYLWQTAVTPAAVQALGESLIDKRRIARWKAEEAELDRKIQSERFDGNTGEALRPAPKPLAEPAPPKAAAVPATPTQK